MGPNPILHVAGSSPAPQTGASVLVDCGGGAPSEFLEILGKLVGEATAQPDAVLAAGNEAPAGDVLLIAHDPEAELRPFAGAALSADASPLAPVIEAVVGISAGTRTAATVPESDDTLRAAPGSGIRRTDRPSDTRHLNTPNDTEQQQILTEPAAAQQEEAVRAPEFAAAAAVPPLMASIVGVQRVETFWAREARLGSTPVARGADSTAPTFNLTYGASPGLAGLTLASVENSPHEFSIGFELARAVPGPPGSVGRPHLEASPIDMPAAAEPFGNKAASPDAGMKIGPDHSGNAMPSASGTSPLPVKRLPTIATSPAAPMLSGADYRIRVAVESGEAGRQAASPSDPRSAVLRADTALPAPLVSSGARTGEAMPLHHLSIAPPSSEPGRAEVRAATHQEAVSITRITNADEAADIKRGPAATVVAIESLAQLPDDDGGHDDLSMLPGSDGPVGVRSSDRGASAVVQMLLPHDTTRRLAEAAARATDRPIEVTLSPEELGRVRLSFTTHDGALTMLVQAERPETLELLRRHIDTLAEDFRELGYEDLAFSFGQQGDERERAETGDLAHQRLGQDDTDSPAMTQPRTELSAPTLGRDGGLDLRM